MDMALRVAAGTSKEFGFEGYCGWCLLCPHENLCRMDYFS